MLLAADIGNTNSTIGLWDSGAWLNHWVITTLSDATADEIGLQLAAMVGRHSGAEELDAAIISSVVPTLSPNYVTAVQNYLQIDPHLVSALSPTGIKIVVDNPVEVGTDRIVNAAAAWDRCHGPCVVVDMGTATTFDVVDRHGSLIGGSIAPGLSTAATALTSRAARLGHVELRAPEKVIGRNTVSAMQSGIVLGYSSMVEGMIARIIEEMGGPEARVIGTGGLIGIIAAHVKRIDEVDRWLTLQGLALVASLLD